MLLQLGFCLSWALHTEKLYDAIGSATFLALALGSLAYGASWFPRQILASVLVCCWWCAQLAAGAVCASGTRLQDNSSLPASFQTICAPAAQHAAARIVPCCSLRLGSFLLYRVVKLGGDSRFKEALSKPLTYLQYWLVQAVWVWATILPLLLLNSATEDNRALIWTDVVGTTLWALGFVCETTADLQKLR